MTVIIVLASVLGGIGYLFVAGFAGTRFLNYQRQRHGCVGESCWTDHEFGAIAAGIGWPIAMPVMFGQWAALRDRKVDELQADIERLEKELGIR